MLNGEKGYAGHSVLIYEVDEYVVKMHDPGLPSCPNRVETIEKFVNAWQNHGANIRAVRIPVNKQF